MARKGRPRKTRDEKLADALKRTEPNHRVQERREVFAGLAASRPAMYEKLDGQILPIDNSCDAIGQLWLAGLLDGHGLDDQAMLTRGRFWGAHYAKIMKGSGCRTAPYERKDRSQSTGALNASDMMFDRMDSALGGYERSVLMDLIVEPLISTSVLSQEITPWAKSLIDEVLLSTGRHIVLMRFPTMDDKGRLDAAVRGLCALVDGALPARWAA